MKRLLIIMMLLISLPLGTMAQEAVPKEITPPKKDTQADNKYDCFPIENFRKFMEQFHMRIMFKAPSDIGYNMLVINSTTSQWAWFFVPTTNNKIVCLFQVGSSYDFDSLAPILKVLYDDKNLSTIQS